MELKETMITILNDISNRVSDEKFSNHYQYKGKRIPRTTEILSSMLHEEYLMNWANSLGWKRKGYRATLLEASNKGTFSHSAIEHYLKDGIMPNFDTIPIIAQESTYNVFYSFLNWWERINKNNIIELIATEKRLSCPYFGGTLDCLLRINSKIWLIDFKTSNHFGYKMFLQLASYEYMLELEDIYIDGCMILQLDKSDILFTEYVLDLSNNKDHRVFFENCKTEFLSLAMAYYGRLQVEEQCKEIFGRK